MKEDEIVEEDEEVEFKYRKVKRVSFMNVDSIVCDDMETFLGFCDPEAAILVIPEGHMYQRQEAVVVCYENE